MVFLPEGTIAGKRGRRVNKRKGIAITLTSEDDDDEDDDDEDDDDEDDDDEDDDDDNIITMIIW